jgi:hypothetical protein
LHFTQGVKKLDVIAFEVWWQGSRFHSSAARDALVKNIRSIWKPFRKLSAEHKDPFDAADAVYSQALEEENSRSALARLMVRRVGRDEQALLSAIYTLVAHALGGNPSWDTADNSGAADNQDPTPAEALAAIMGFDRAFRDTISGIGAWLPGPVDIPALLSQLDEVGGFDEQQWVSTIRAVSDGELETARARARALAVDLPVAVRALQHYMSSPDFAGFEFFALARTEREALQWRVGLVAAFLLFRSIAQDDAMNGVMDEIGKASRKCREYIAVLEAFPHYAIYFRHDKDKQLAGVSEEFSDMMFREVHDFLAGHPDLKADIEDH